MKKIHFFVIAMAFAGLGLISRTGLQAVALEGNPPPYLSTQGGALENDGFIIGGKFPRSTGGMGSNYVITSVSVTAGQVVCLTTVAGLLSVTLTATAGDIRALGVAVTGATAGNMTQVITHGGSIVRVVSAINSTVGMIMVTSATAGKVTNSTAVTVDSYTAVSQTAFIARALETKTITVGTDDMVLVEILK